MREHTCIEGENPFASGKALAPVGLDYSVKAIQERRYGENRRAAAHLALYPPPIHKYPERPSACRTVLAQPYFPFRG
jgi:hypothetical protein